MLNKHLGCFGDKFWGEEDHSVEDSGKVEGRNGSLQTEASLQVYNVDSEDLMRWHDLGRSFFGLSVPPFVYIRDGLGIV